MLDNTLVFTLNLQTIYNLNGLYTKFTNNIQFETTAKTKDIMLMNFQVTILRMTINSNLQVYFYVQNVITYKVWQISVNNYEVHKLQKNGTLSLQSPNLTWASFHKLKNMSNHGYNKVC